MRDMVIVSKHRIVVNVTHIQNQHNIIEYRTENIPVSFQQKYSQYFQQGKEYRYDIAQYIRQKYPYIKDFYVEKVNYNFNGSFYIKSVKISWMDEGDYLHIKTIKIGKHVSEQYKQIVSYTYLPVEIVDSIVLPKHFYFKKLVSSGVPIFINNKKDFLQLKKVLKYDVQWDLRNNLEFIHIDY